MFLSINGYVGDASSSWVLLDSYFCAAANQVIGHKPINQFTESPIVMHNKNRVAFRLYRRTVLSAVVLHNTINAAPRALFKSQRKGFALYREADFVQKYAMSQGRRMPIARFSMTMSAHAEKRVAHAPHPSNTPPCSGYVHMMMLHVGLGDPVRWGVCVCRENG